jgi:hypothetical protein
MSDNVFRVLDGEDNTDGASAPSTSSTISSTLNGSGGNSSASGGTGNADSQSKDAPAGTSNQNGSRGGSGPVVSLQSQSTEEGGDSTAWTAVQSSTRRRLAPQYSITGKDLGVDNSASKESNREKEKEKEKDKDVTKDLKENRENTSGGKSATADLKKKGIYFTLLYSLQYSGSRSLLFVQ